MNAGELIEEFKRLPLEEKGKVIEFFRQDLAGAGRYAENGAAKSAAESVFEEHPELFRKLAQ